MPKWIPVVVIVVIVVGLMYLTNPTMDMYAGWVTGEALTRIEDVETVEYLQRHGVKAVEGMSERKNYYVLSLYGTDVDNIQVRAVGVFGVVVPYRISGL